MNKTSIRTFILFLTTVMFFGPALKSEALYPAYVQQESSKPVLVNGLEFVAYVQTQWCISSPPVIELQITNRTHKQILCPSFGTFGIVIKSSDGSMVLTSMRRATRLTAPILIAPDSRYSLIRSATLDFDVDTKSNTFQYFDGTGTCTFNQGPFKKGKYFLSFWFANVSSPGTYDAIRKTLNLDESDIWTGQAATSAVEFELLDPQSRSMLK